MQIGAGNSHQPHGANANSQYGVAQLDVSQIRPHGACGHHIAHHARLLQAHVFRYQRQVAVGIIDVAVFGKNTVFEVRKLPAAQHAAGVHGKAGLGFQTVPVRGNGRDQYTIAHLEAFDQCAHLDHLTAALMAKDHVLSLADGAFPYGVNIRGAGGHSQRLDDGVHGAADGALLFDPPRAANA